MRYVLFVSMLITMPVYAQHRGELSIAYRDLPSVDGWYRVTPAWPKLPAEDRLLLHFESIVGDIEVYWNDQRIASRRDDPMPFQIDITDIVNRIPKGELRFRLTGDATGLLESISWRQIPDTDYDTLNMVLDANPKTGVVRWRVPITGKIVDRMQFAAETGPRNNPWKHRIVKATPSSLEWQGEIPVRNPAYWFPCSASERISNHEPNLLSFRLLIYEGAVAIPYGFRSAEFRKEGFFVNDRQFLIRAVMMERLPLRSQIDFSAQITQLKRAGFNTFRFPGWLPSQAMLHVADQANIMLWIDLPKHYRREWIAYLGRHPSVCIIGGGDDVRDAMKELAPGVAFFRSPTAGVDDRVLEVEPWVSKYPERAQRWIESILRHTTLQLPLFEQMQADSRLFAFDGVQQHIERLRFQEPGRGYVVRTIELPCDETRWSHAAKSWQLWDGHGEHLTILGPPDDPRSIPSNGTWSGEIRIASGYSVYRNWGVQTLERSITTPAELRRRWRIRPLLLPETPDRLWTENTMLSLPFQTIIVANEVDQPRSERLELSTKSGPRSWDFWVMPERGSTDLLHGVERHASVSKELGQRLFPDSDLAVTTGSVRNGRAESGVVIARSLDLALVDYLEAGGRVLLLPDGNPGSFVTRTYPFSSPGLVIGNHPSIRRVPYRALLNTIRRDLGSSMVPDLPILGQVELIILIGELGDDQRVNTHGLVFQMTVGKGRLLVSALKHDHSAIGGYLLDEFVIHLATGLLPRCGLAPAEIETFRRRIRAGENLSF